MKELKTKKGVLKYRLPNIFEAARIISLMGQVENREQMQEKIMQVCVDLIDESSIGYSSKLEMTDDLDMIRPMYDVTAEVVNAVTEVWAKKKE